MRLIAGILKSLRVYQWVKNIFIFFPLVFAGHLKNQNEIVLLIAAFFLFSFAASSVYLFNDIADYEKDKIHPVKKHRPLPSGSITKLQAGITSFALAAIACNGAFLVKPMYAVLLAGYFVINLLYSFGLKNIAIVDVFFLSFGFIIRIVSGAVVIDVPVSHWILVCTFSLTLFLGFAKRRNEMILMGEKGNEHRVSLKGYSITFLDQCLSITAGATLISYLLYTISPETISKFGTSDLVYTAPPVFYGVFRYLFLVNNNNGTGDPSRLLLSDKGIAVSFIVWIFSAVVLIYR